MNVEDEDPAWLEACMAAVDRLPGANLSHESTTTPAAGSSKSNTTTARDCGNICDTPSVHQHVPRGSSSGCSMAMPPRADELPIINNAVGRSETVVAPVLKDGSVRVGSRVAGTKWSSTATTAPPPPDAAFANRHSDKFPHVNNGRSISSSRERSRAPPLPPNESLRRKGGIGVPPDDGMKRNRDCGGLEVDPCWRCGEATRFMEFGTRRFYGCSSHPLCNATRPTPKNGAVVELIAEEKRHTTADADATSGCFPAGVFAGPAAATASAYRSDPTGITRCQLCVKVRGGHSGGGAGRVWAILRRNGILPEQPEGANFGNGGGDECLNTITGGPAGTRELKAIMALGKRDAVKRLLKQEGLAYRDIPQTTYSRLISSGAGHETPTPSQARRGKGKAAKDQEGSLEPLPACDALLYKLPAGLRDTLLPFQLDGVLYGLRRKGRCLIADEMGTGKTLQALAVMGCYREDWPLLIVAPASMRLMWAEEVEHWYPFLDPSQIHLIKGNKDKLYLTNISTHLWPRVVIVSYFMLRMLAESVGKTDWKAVIFDESHMISTKLGDKSTQALQVTVCMDVAKRAERVVMLSGTPSLSKPFEIFNQVEALSPGLLSNENDPVSKAKNTFASNYCGGRVTKRQGGKDGVINRVPFVGGSEYPDELHLLLKNEVMIRRLKIHILNQLPPIRRIVVRVLEHREELRRALKAGGFEADVDAEDGGGDAGGGGQGRGHAGAGQMSEDQRAGLKKVKSASEWVIDKLISSQETLTKFVVFAHHKTVLDRLQEAFEAAGSPRVSPFNTRAGGGGGGGDGANTQADGESSSFIRRGFTCLRIDGSVPTSVRATRLSEFNTSRLCRVLLVSITAGGQGLDFTAASNVVFVELPESPAWLRQAEDRLHRRRQENGVNVYLTVLPPGSHDDARWRSLNERLVTQTSVVNGTLHAENMDVDRVCDAGGILDHDGPMPSLTSRHRQRYRRRDESRMRKKGPRRQDVSCNAGGVVGEDDDDLGGFEYDVLSYDSSDKEENGASDGSDDGRDAGGEGVGETDLDAELRVALLSTPLDVLDHRPSQSPTLQLLRAIARSPSPQRAKGNRKPNIFRRIVAAAAANATKQSSPAGGGNHTNGNAQGAGAEHRRRRDQDSRQAGDALKHENEASGVSFGTGRKAKATTSASSKGSPARIFAAATPSRKRPRSADVSSQTGSANPFAAFGHRSRPPPPSTSARLGIGSGSPPPRRSVSLPGGDVDTPGAMDLDVGVSKSGVEGDACAMAPTPSRSSRGSGGGGGTPDTASSSCGGHGSVLSPVLLVDLSQDEEQNENVADETEGGRGSDGQGVPSASMSALDGSRLPPVAIGGVPAEGGRESGAPLLPLPLPLSGPRGVSNSYDEVKSDAPDEWPDGGEGRESDAQRHREGKGAESGKEEDRDLSSRLYFLVSGNTGRVHVYKKTSGEGGGDGEVGGDSSDDEEERKPQHCRCNFRPEDLDRLFEAAKEALLRSEKSSARRTSALSEGRTAKACEAAAKDALSALPALLRSAPALRVAKTFLQEWRALSSRKRPLLRNKPCRPPLADELERVTPLLTGSTRRYADTARSKTQHSKGSSAGGSSDDLSCALTGNSIRSSSNASDKTMCLFCEEEAASEQGPAVHRRDRYCSVRCMEEHGARKNYKSLRRLVLERDHGVCAGEGCGRDCLTLVSRLTAVRNHERRRDILVAADPRFGDERHRTLRERLVRHPKGGNAWNADHVTAVYQGGGECGVDNLRTLCVLCHSEVTRVQTTERAAARRLAKENERRSLEAAQGQRQLVGFGGGIALSAGSSQGSNVRNGGGSKEDACEISSDENDANYSEEAGRAGCSKRGGGIAGGSLSTLCPAFRHNPPPTACGGRQQNSEATRSTSHGQVRRKAGTAADKTGTRDGGKWRSGRASLEAFERLVGGEDCCFDTRPSAATQTNRSLSQGGQGGGGRGGSVQEARGDDSDGSCEITFTRVLRPDSSVFSSARAKPGKGAPWNEARVKLAPYRPSGYLSESSEAGSGSAGNDSD